MRELHDLMKSRAGIDPSRISARPLVRSCGRSPHNRPAVASTPLPACLREVGFCVPTVPGTASLWVDAEMLAA